MEYKASFDTLTKILSLGIILLFIFVGWKNVKALLVAQGDITIILIHGGMFAIICTTLVISYLFSIQKYVIRQHELLIQRPIGDKKVLITDMVEIELVEKRDMVGTIRTFGSGGFFGYYGKHYNKKFGFITLYTTQNIHRVFIRTKTDNKIIISPDDLSLVDILKAKLKKYQIIQSNDKLQN